MAHTITLPATGTGTATPVVSTEDITTLNGGAVSARSIQRVGISLITAAATAVDAPGDAANGVDVDVTRVPTDPFGENADAASATGSISAKLRQIAAAILAEDAAHTSGDPGILALAVRRDTPASSSGTDVDNSTLNTDALGRLWTAPPPRIRVTATPTLSTSLYTAGDQYGGVMTFANMALANGGGGRIVGAQISNRDAETPLLEMWICRVSPTMTNSDNGVFSLSAANAEAAEIVGVIEFSSWWVAGVGVFSQGVLRGAPLSAAPLEYLCGSSSTSLYGIMAIRNGVTHAGTTDVIVSLITDRC